MDNRATFFLSAFVAVALYILLVLSFLLYLQKERVQKFKNIASQTVLEVNILTDEKKDFKQNKSSTVKPKKVEKTIVKKDVSSKPKKTSDLKSLFKDVNTKANKIVQKTVNKTKANQVESRFKSKYQREKKNENIKLSKLVDVKDSTSKQDIKKINNKGEGKTDLYYSKINTMILTRWYNYPLLNNQRYIVVANITIDTQGNFSYHIVSLSGIENVDTTIKEFLNNQRLEKYPISPDKKTKTIKINFKPDQNS